MEKVVNGQRVTVKIKIQIKLTVRMTWQQANKAIFDELCKAGLYPTKVVRRSPFFNAPIPSWGLECDIFGNPVHHVILWRPV